MGIEGFGRNEQATANEKKRLERTGFATGCNAEMLEALPGTTNIRVLPIQKTVEQGGQFFKEIFKHDIFNEYERSRFIAICPAGMELGECAICEKGEELYNSKEEAAIEVADKLKPRRRFIYNVLCYNGPMDKQGQAPEFGKVYVFEAGPQAHRQIVELDQDAAAGWDDITSIEKGVNLVIKRTGEGLGTKYNVTPHGNGRTNVMDALKEGGVDSTKLKLYDLDAVYTPPSAEKLAEVAAKIKVPSASVTPPVAFAPVTAPAPVAPVAPVAHGGYPGAPVTVSQETVAAPVVSQETVAAPLIPAPPVEK